MKFTYKKLKAGHTRPIIPIEIEYQDKRADYFVLVDSGADVCLFPQELGEFLGIDIERGETRNITGIVEGQTRTMYEHPVMLKVGGWSFPSRVYFMQDLSQQGYGLVGQTGFFDLFRNVKFEKRKNVLELNK